MAAREGKEHVLLGRLGVAKPAVTVANNTNSNDTIIAIMMKEIDPSIKDIAPYRSHCLRHIINLALKAFLFSKDSKAFEAIAELVDDSTLMDSLIVREA